MRQLGQRVVALDDPDTGEVRMVEAPNAPILLAGSAYGVSRAVEPGGLRHRLALATATGAYAWWGTDEILNGTSPYRRMVGALGLAWAGYRAGAALRNPAIA